MLVFSTANHDLTRRRVFTISYMKGLLLLTFLLACSERDTSDVDWLLFSEKNYSGEALAAARDRKFWLHLRASHFCVHAYLLQFVCQGYSVVTPKKITRYLCWAAAKKDKKQLVNWPHKGQDWEKPLSASHNLAFFCIRLDSHIHC